MPQTRQFRAEWAAFAITAITVIGAIILLMANKTVPDQLWGIGAGSGLVGAGAMSPGRII